MLFRKPGLIQRIFCDFQEVGCEAEREGSSWSNPLFLHGAEFATQENRLCTSELPLKGDIYEYIPTSFSGNAAIESLPNCVPLAMTAVEQQKRSTSEVKLFFSCLTICDNHHAQPFIFAAVFPSKLPINRR